MVVGGAATFAWGDPRTTRDLDLAVEAREETMDEIGRLLQAAGLDPDGPFTTEFGHRFIVPFEGGLPVDVFIDDRSDLFDRRREVEVGETYLWVKSPEDVVLEKLENAGKLPDERNRDLSDATAILDKQGDRFDLDYARSRCKELSVCELLETLIDELDRQDG